MTFLTWLLHTDAGLLARILAGAAVFAILAAVDLKRRGRAATRWREYAVLLAAVAAALAYGAVNDQVTVTISREYFLYGKELYKAIGENPTDPVLRWGAAKVGLKATWSVGLILGVALLVANNPWRGRPRLRYRRLVARLPVMVAAAAAVGVAGGLAGYAGWLTGLQSHFGDLVRANLWHPRRFMATWGVHLGGYVGGLLGAGVAVVAVARERRSLPRDGPAFPVGPVL